MSVTYLMGHDSCHKKMQCTAVYKLIKYLQSTYYVSIAMSGTYLFKYVELKFGFSEKATKFEKIFVVLLTRASCSVRATAYLSKSRKVDEDFSKQMWSSRIIL